MFWQEAIQVGNLHRTANVDDVLVCNPLLVLCSVMDCEHDVFFTNGGRCHTKHDQTGEETEIRHGGGHFEIDAEVIFPIGGSVRKSLGRWLRRGCCARA